MLALVIGLLFVSPTLATVQFAVSIDNGLPVYVSSIRSALDVIRESPLASGAEITVSAGVYIVRNGDDVDLPADIGVPVTIVGNSNKSVFRRIGIGGWTGMRVLGGTYSVQNLTFYGFAVGIEVSDASSGSVVIDGNAFYDFNVGVSVSGPTNTADDTPDVPEYGISIPGNYYGDPSGPQSPDNAIGRGARVTGAVSVIPYYTNENMHTLASLYVTSDLGTAGSSGIVYAVYSGFVGSGNYTVRSQYNNFRGCDGPAELDTVSTMGEVSVPAFPACALSGPFDASVTSWVLESGETRLSIAYNGTILETERLPFRGYPFMVPPYPRIHGVFEDAIFVEFALNMTGDVFYRVTADELLMDFGYIKDIAERKVTNFTLHGLVNGKMYEIRLSTADIGGQIIRQIYNIKAKAGGDMIVYPPPDLHSGQLVWPPPSPPTNHEDPAWV